ncbi:MAG: hypothetical protein IKY98_03715 [Alphaproteobacteria bacterium]|nr:hypothetical protein [Alphaproteobacteria bacterium]
MTTKNIKNNDETAPLLSTADDYSFPLSPSDNDTSSPLSPLGKDIMPLDSREGSEYDNLASSSLSFPCLTRESRKHEYQIESGRSMVEMLGVLAVIGVLSIGGIAGYSYGMDKYRANETMNDINLRAIDVITQISHGKEPNLSAEWGIMGRAGYPITLNTDYAPSQYFIKVENVPLKVCRLIMDTMPENINIWVNENDNKCQKELNMMEFEYTGFVKQGCRTSAECRIDTPVCNPDTGVCEPYPDDEACGGCPPEKPYCDESSGQCSSCKYDSDCPENMLCLHKNEAENACLTYDFVPILSASESPDGREWIGLKVQSRYVQFDNAVKICKKYDKTLAYPDELTDSSAQKTDLTLAIQQVDGLHHTWSNQENPNDATQAFLLNLSGSGTATARYYYSKKGAFYAYCR